MINIRCAIFFLWFVEHVFLTIFLPVKIAFFVSRDLQSCLYYFHTYVLNKTSRNKRQPGVHLTRLFVCYYRKLQRQAEICSHFRCLCSLGISLKRPVPKLRQGNVVLSFMMSWTPASKKTYLDHLTGTYHSFIALNRRQTTSENKQNSEQRVGSQ